MPLGVCKEQCLLMCVLKKENIYWNKTFLGQISWGNYFISLL